MHCSGTTGYTALNNCHGGKFLPDKPNFVLVLQHSLTMKLSSLNWNNGQHWPLISRILNASPPGCTASVLLVCSITSYQGYKSTYKQNYTSSNCPQYMKLWARRSLLMTNTKLQGYPKPIDLFPTDHLRRQTHPSLWLHQIELLHLVHSPSSTLRRPKWLQ